mmetsp:Transcript_68870/g.177435  ORF Transcript_68870/g.177435 Transcript_68870/m.177435 type:complete len:221 (+) Transcript_68870:498-1160(+)
MPGARPSTICIVTFCAFISRRGAWIRFTTRLKACNADSAPEVLVQGLAPLPEGGDSNRLRPLAVSWTRALILASRSTAARRAMVVLQTAPRPLSSSAKASSMSASRIEGISERALTMSLSATSLLKAHDCLIFDPDRRWDVSASTRGVDSNLSDACFSGLSVLSSDGRSPPAIGMSDGTWRLAGRLSSLRPRWLICGSCFSPGGAVLGAPSRLARPWLPG